MVVQIFFITMIIKETISYVVFWFVPQTWTASSNLIETKKWLRTAEFGTNRPNQKQKSCLVALHSKPLIFENCKNVFTVQKCTAPNFQNSIKAFFFLWEFWSLCPKLLLSSTCLHFDTGLKIV